MKKWHIVMSIVALAGCQPNEQKKLATDAATASIEVKTARCEMCVKNITAALENTEGVEEVVVDLEKKLATVKYAPAKTNLTALEKAIAFAGYDANATKRDSAAYLALAKCCQ